MESKIESEVTNEAAEVDVAAETSESSQAEAEIKRISTKDIIAYLAEKFPACFSIQGPAKALKVGIFQELAEKLADDETVSKTRLRQALRHYTSSWRYLKAIKLGAFRYDVEGNQAAEIDQEQADYALKTLLESQEKFGNKKTKDTGNKKPYKNKKSERSEVKPATKDKTKFKSVKSSNKTVSKPVIKLKPAEVNKVKVGNSVKVQLGNTPLDAVITEVSGEDVSVQLNSGMVVKTQISNIFTE